METLGNRPESPLSPTPPHQVSHLHHHAQQTSYQEKDSSVGRSVALPSLTHCSGTPTALRAQEPSPDPRPCRMGSRVPESGAAGTPKTIQPTGPAGSAAGWHDSVHIPKLNLGCSPLSSLLQNMGEASACKQLSPEGGGWHTRLSREHLRQKPHISQDYLAMERHSPGEGEPARETARRAGPSGPLGPALSHTPPVMVSLLRCGETEAQEVSRCDPDHVTTKIMIQ